jgi:hypothetical protein
MDGSLCVWGGRVRLVMGRGVRTVEHSFLWLARVRVHTILNQSVTVRESDSQSSSRRPRRRTRAPRHARRASAAASPAVKFAVGPAARTAAQPRHARGPAARDYSRPHGSRRRLAFNVKRRPPQPCQQRATSRQHEGAATTTRDRRRETAPHGSWAPPSSRREDRTRGRAHTAHSARVSHEARGPGPPGGPSARRPERAAESAASAGCRDPGPARLSPLISRLVTRVSRLDRRGGTRGSR